ncbi:AMP-binding protein [Streptomyces sp. NPDC091266]|uniref:AMP-binding protein n=1 Tax=Streptomyces sp. NPDC091266 TaxID=3365978 RepID=UPI00381EE235
MSRRTRIEEQLHEVRARQARAREGRQPGTPPDRIGPATVPGLVHHWARTAPDRTALVFADGPRRDEIYSYRALDDASDRLAGYLASRGVGAGDRVGVHLPNCPEFLLAMLAVLRLGAVHVPVNPMFKPEELRHELTDAGAVLVVTADDLAPALDAARTGTAVRDVLVTGSADWTAALAHPPLGRIADDPDALAALNYTGGTTGMPKGCEHTQRHMVYTATAIEAGRPPGLRDDGIVSLCYLPVFWIAGENLGILAPLVSGGTGVLLPRWDPGTVLAVLERHHVSTMAGTVENYLELLDHPDLPRRDLSALTAPLTVSFIRKLTPGIRARWHTAVGAHSTLREASYGMTETHTSDTNTLGFQDDDHDLTTTPVFCGLPVPGTDILIADFGTGEPLPLGDRGEIIVRSPSVMTRYWNAQQATERALRHAPGEGDGAPEDRWLHTGDIGSLDGDGALHYHGRDKDMIKVSGMSVFPTEVETLLGRHPDVLAAAVVAVDDTRRGQLPYAYVRTAPGSQLTADGLRDWASGSMASYKLPLVELVDTLPMTATGKIRKTELAARASRMRPSP